MAAETATASDDSRQVASTPQLPHAVLTELSRDGVASRQPLRYECSSNRYTTVESSSSAAAVWTCKLDGGVSKTVTTTMQQISIAASVRKMTGRFGMSSLRSSADSATV